MSKTLKTNDLTERPAIRTLLVISLCAAMAAFGCTTDRNLGNGDPVVTPGLRTSPIGGNSSGSETPVVPPPMMSSYTGADALPVVRPRLAPQTTAAEAAAIMAEHQPRVRVLGPASPDSGGRPYYSDRMAYPSQQASYGSSINSTIYNPNPNGAAITSGVGESVFSDTGIVDTTATNMTGAATVIPTAGGAGTPTSAAIAVPSGFAAVGTLSPTAAAVVNPPASISSSSTLAAASSSRTAGRTLTPATPTTNATTTNAATMTVGTGATSTVNPIRVMNTNGRIVVTNTSPSRQQ
jgi:hypothetical protein